jgi:hypothetical protein
MKVRAYKVKKELQGLYNPGRDMLPMMFTFLSCPEREQTFCIVVAEVNDIEAVKHERLP